MTTIRCQFRGTGLGTGASFPYPSFVRRWKTQHTDFGSSQKLASYALVELCDPGGSVPGHLQGIFRPEHESSLRKDGKK